MGRKLVASAVIGMGISFLVTLVMLNIFARNSSGAQILDAATLWMIAGAFYGVVSCVINPDISRWMRMVVHFLLNMVISIVFAQIMFSKVFMINPDYFLPKLVVIFVVIYLIIAAAIIIYERADVKMLNDKLKSDGKN